MGVHTRGQSDLRPALSAKDIRALKIGFPVDRHVERRLERAFAGPDGFDRLYTVAHAHGIPAHVLGGRNKADAVRDALDHAGANGNVVQFVEGALGLLPSAKATETRIDKAALVVERYFFSTNHMLSDDDLDVKARGNGLVARLRNYGYAPKVFEAQHARDLVEVRGELARAGYPDITIKIEEIPEAAYP